MYAIDVMTRDVITIEPTASVQTLATLLSERGISGVPVVDAEQRLVGIVSEGDLLHRAETQTERRLERRRPRWFESTTSELARDYVKSHGRTVADVMTRDVITVVEMTDLADVAMLMETKRVKRIPVVRRGQCVGIISRANLVRALVAAKPAPSATSSTDDRNIKAKLISELRGREWVHAWAADILVRDAVVHLWVTDDQSPEERHALRVAAENVTGVKGVEEHVVSGGLIPVF
ncbi:MAG: CBS domain-containing protein [Alphaproteobacteria bacterium]|nr:CBS domain-containing protein [Alphaproteobacteria bacterium]